MKPLYILLAWFCFGCGFVLSGASPAADKKAGEAAALAQQAETRLQQAASRQDFEEVAKLLNQAARLDRKNLDVQFKLGWVYLDKLHDPHAAYPHLAKVVASRPDDANATKLFALACSQTGHPRTAVAQFRRASLLQPDDLWIRANLGRSLARLGRFDEASAIYEEILKKDPANFDARLGQAELAAWRGTSATSLQMLDDLAKSNPSNAEVLTLSGDLHRWKGELTQARQDYLQALQLETNYTGAANGLREADRLSASHIGVEGYQFKDRTKFLREYLALDARIHLTDRAYLLGRGAGWRFTHPGFDELDRADGSVGLEYHWARFLETSIQGDVFDYEHREAFFGGRFSSKLTPKPGWDIYTIVSANQPFISSISTVENALRQDSVGSGLDFKLGHGFSFQNSLQLAKLSDHNTWWEDKPQLSYRLFRNSETFLRAEYEYLTYNHPRPDYWTPHQRHVASPVFDTSIPLGQHIQITLDARAPYVFNQSKFGYQVEGGPAFDLFGRAQLKGSYIYSRIPGDQGAWSGHGWLAYFQVRF